jgi:DNA polymerase-3 subunit delta
MATPTLTYDALVRQLNNKQYAPVYLLHGEEGYYIDALVKEFEKILPEDEKDFNQYTLYAPQVDMGAVIDVCMRVPMMSEHQVVILKEAQAIRADQLNKLHRYAARPLSTTILVICCRGQVAKGKELIAAVRANGVVFESKKVSEYNIPPLIAQYIKTKGMTAEQKSLDMLRDFIGTDLSRLFNEIDKLAGILGQRAAITPEAIERYIGVSKEFNSFELVDALAAHDEKKVYRIAEYFRSNPKANPLVMTSATIFGFFSDVLVAYYAPDRSDQGLMNALKLKSSFQLRRYRAAMSHYNAFQVIEIMSALRDFDAKSKGVGSRLNEHALFRQLMHHILTAPGNLGV